VMLSSHLRQVFQVVFFLCPAKIVYAFLICYAHYMFCPSHHRFDHRNSRLTPNQKYSDCRHVFIRNCEHINRA
jgi:hypothetical protein